MSSGKISLKEKTRIRELLIEQSDQFNIGKKATAKRDYSTALTALQREFCATKELRDMFTSLEQKLQARKFNVNIKYI